MKTWESKEDIRVEYYTWLKVNKNINQDVPEMFKSFQITGKDSNIEEFLEKKNLNIREVFKYYRTLPDFVFRVELNNKLNSDIMELFEKNGCLCSEVTCNGNFDDLMKQLNRKDTAGHTWKKIKQFSKYALFTEFDPEIKAIIRTWKVKCVNEETYLLELN